MIKFKFERTQYGYKAYANNIYFGHFYTQREAKQAYTESK